ncbi:MAG: tRNA lysidine(34) synthetase TilS [Alphaproteobacteria bacterium]|nr:tRNA lysidine(34) synthetase TilS [Alphaproteobacteria bacterium]MDP6589954.1 tRNA lysidine(34) synthetase TilS [Alphaproteobacteria bacterium]MDP6816910.1 tRNA lysidine(34) synthetase TilS [Alphaproteobacteria bacterium]
MKTPLIVQPGDAPATGKALSDAEFHRLMAPAGPFEPAPHLAVAVSGGSDSLALCLLADGWARRRKGRVTALTVEHGLRPESPAEAKQVARWLKGRGIAHRTLPWRGRKPGSGVQAAARGARMALLADWCRRHHVLHLLSGHQLEDQAATLLLRLCAGSGGEGLAAMPLVQDLDVPGSAAVRLVRPLLGTPEQRLKAVLRDESQAWIDDPSNRDSAYARTRLAVALDQLGGEGMTAPRLARTARRLGKDRAALDIACGELLARSALPHPAGFARLDWAEWRKAPDAVSLRALIRLLASVGARPFGPRLERVERLCEELRGGYPERAATLGGCRILPYRATLLICREPGAVQGSVAVKPGQALLWDGRFRIALPRRAEFTGQCRLGKLGAQGISRLRRAMADGDAALARIPPPARPALPAFRDLDGVLAVPHLNYVRSTAQRGFRAEYYAVENPGGNVFGPPA